MNITKRPQPKSGSLLNGLLNPTVIITLAIVAGVILFWKNIQAVLNPLTNIFKASGSAIEGFTNYVGLTQSKEAKEVDKTVMTSGNPFDKNFYKTHPPGTKLKTRAYCEDAAKKIWGQMGGNSIVPVFFPDSGIVYDVINSFPTQAAISYLCDVFGQLYNHDMLTFIKDSTMFSSGLSDEDVLKIINMAKAKPKY